MELDIGIEVLLNMYLETDMQKVLDTKGSDVRGGLDHDFDLDIGLNDKNVDVRAKEGC